MQGKTIDEIKVGDWAEFSKTISEADVYLYSGVTGDMNPAHINEVYARETFFKGRIVHGMLLGGMISAVLAMKLPGPGTIYVGQTLNFLAPVRFGDTITAKVEVVGVDRAKNRVRINTSCINEKEQEVLNGEAIVSPPKGKPR
jgi:3-hydroxybutyryl-CoA dehydratase